MSDRTALVLGGGGLAGIAWELGMLVGLQEAGSGVGDAELVVGTSAGSVVGTLVAAGVDLEDAYAAQLAETASEKSVEVDLEQLMTSAARAIAGTRDKQQRLAAVGRLALDASTVPEAERLAIITSRLPSSAWPERPLRLTAVDTASGARVVFDRDGHVGLVEAVASSCAVPGVWPPVTVGDRRYMDGGIYSILNADLAAGAERVLVLAPMAGQEHNPFGTTIAEEDAQLREAGASEVLVINADEESTASFGSNPLDPASRAPAARAGRRQAADCVDQVRGLWRR
jgi:NTE family protein